MPLWIDLTAVVVGALAGPGIAARERFDVIGALLLAVVMGLGGGIIRDLLLGLRPVAVTSRYYLPAVAAAALAGASVYAGTAVFGAPTGVSQAAGLAVVVAMRLAALRWGLGRSRGPALRTVRSAPVPAHGRSPASPVTMRTGRRASSSASSARRAGLR